MAGTLRTFVLALLTIIGPVVPRLSAAQELAIPGRLDLNGTWELTEYGARLAGRNAIVRITHSGRFVSATFISGAECAAGGPRPDAFLAELTVHPTVPPTGQLSSPAMWVCSGSPDLVRMCGAKAAVKPSYKTTFTNASVEPDFIEGTRVRQGTRGCNLDASANGTAPFTLRRLAPCAVAERRLTDAEKDVLDLGGSILGARVAFRAAIEAAQRRFGETYRGRPTDTLRYPYQQVTTVDPADSLEMIALLGAVAGYAAEDPQWTATRDMAADMGLLANPPLIQAQGMLEQMYRIERTAPDARRSVAAYYSAREELQKCRASQQR